MAAEESDAGTVVIEVSEAAGYMLSPLSRLGFCW